MSFHHDNLAAIQRYNDRLSKFGASQEALGWGKKGRARLRYEILLSQWNVTDKKVLDFGCGFGDLAGYIEEKGITSFSYLGLDINKNFIDIAQSKFPQHQFFCCDILQTKPVEKVDYCFSSGVFNHKMSDNKLFIKNILDALSQISNEGFAVNFLSDKVEFREEQLFYANPSEMLEMAYNYSNNVVLRNDYMPYEFTLFVNQAQKIDPTFTVYENYLNYL